MSSLWVTEKKGPADFSWDADRAGARKGFAPSNGGTYLLVVDFPPVGPEVDKLDMNTMMNVVGADAPKRGNSPSNPLMHRTRTVDYAMIMAGEIDMMLDTGTVHLKAGDVVVQQATNHAWLNHGKRAVPHRLCDDGFTRALGARVNILYRLAIVAMLAAIRRVAPGMTKEPPSGENALGVHKSSTWALGLGGWGYWGDGGRAVGPYFTGCRTANVREVTPVTRRRGAVVGLVHELRTQSPAAPIAIVAGLGDMGGETAHLGKMAALAGARGSPGAADSAQLAPGPRHSAGYS